MPVNEREATALVDVLLRAYPTYPADRDTRLLYEHALVNDKHPPAVMAAAVQSWISNESLMPKISELLDAIKVQSAMRRMDDSERLRTAGALPPGALPSTPNHASALRLRLIRQVNDEMPVTDTRRVSMTAEQRDEYAARFAARLDELVSEHADVLVADEPLETFVCPNCLDVGWIEESVIEGVSTALRPCPCRPDLYDRWRAGHFAPNHHCAACEALKRGKRTSS